MLLQSQIAHGESVVRAFLGRCQGRYRSGPARDGAGESTRLQAVAVELRSQLRTLTDRLSEVERARADVAQDLQSAFS
jgi:hypothetical protein